MIYKFKHWFRYRVLNRRVGLPAWLAGVPAIWCWRKSKPLLVYQMGKVASKAVIETIEQQQCDYTLFHIHELTERGIEDGLRIRDSARPQSKSHLIKLGTTCDPKAYPNLIRSHLLRRTLLGAPELQYTVISLVRDPVATLISHAFTAVEVFRPQLLNQSGSVDIELVTDYLHQELRNFDVEQGDYVSNWFDQEFRPFTGIDVYQHEFSSERGYSIIQGKRQCVLIIQAEVLNQQFPDAFEELTGIKIAGGVRKANTRRVMVNGDVYKNVRESIYFRREDLENLYSTKYVRHFYSHEYITKKIREWSEPPPNVKQLSRLE